MISGWIDAGMRSGIPVIMHPCVVACYEDVFPYLRDLGLDDPGPGLSVPAGTEGRVPLSAKGYADKEDIAG
jgi:hypothetical protein